MDFASSPESRSRWKGIVANSSVVPADDLPMLWDRIDSSYVSVPEANV